MIIVKLMGGLGNQMFQYAFGKHLALRNETELLLDLNFLLDRTPKKLFVYRDFDLSIFDMDFHVAQPKDLKPFNIQRESRIAKFRRISRQKRIERFYPERYYHISETSFAFNRGYLYLPQNTYLDGFWQSEQYFKNSENEIRESFRFKHNLNSNAGQLAKAIQSVNAVCVNVRRGYVNNLKERLFHGLLGIDYFEQAVKIIQNKVESPHFFVFSDDIDWCKQNIRISAPLEFVTHDCAGTRFNNYLQLMILCNHFIIPNSSFGWWAAWLNRNPEKLIIAPKKWFRIPFKNTRDLVPPRWIIL